MKVTLTAIPALSESKSVRLVLVTALYAAQGIQMGLMMVAIPAYLAGKQASAAMIGGFIAAILLPWSLKVLTGPIMDRYSFLPMGRRRPWVLFGLFGAIIGYLTMGLVTHPLDHFLLFTSAAVVVSSFTAFLDVAIDGMAIEIFPLDEQAQANSFMWGGKVIGAALTTGGAGWTLKEYGLEVTCLVAAFFSIVFFLLPLLMRERPGERLFPWSKGQASAFSLEYKLDSWKEIIGSLVKVIFLPASILISLVSFCHGITYGLFDAMMPVISIQKLGWSDQSYSNLSALSGIIAGVLGAISGKYLVKWFGRKSSLTYLFLALILAASAMGLAPSVWDRELSIESYVITTYILRTLVLIILFATAMAICWQPVAATQFALYMAIANFGISTGAALLGPLNSQFTYPQILFVFSVILLISIAILSRIKLESHVEFLTTLTDERHQAMIEDEKGSPG
ncbi:MAG: MFS transporter [Saprospiraceae bacterium]|nr:MFS transporter [Saprospiraceae bacterium]